MKNLIILLIVTSLAVACGNKEITFDDPIPQHESLTIKSNYLKEDRIINIWTPPNHDKSNDSLPVLYMADGGIKEDFPHIANTLDTLIKQNKIPKIILVGIENTQRKRDLTGPTAVDEDRKIAPEVGKSQNFRDFIKNEVMTEIAKRYRTTKKKGIIGESLSGFFVVETLQLAPEMFDFYIAMDPALWWNDQYLIKNAKVNFNNLPNKKIRFWFAGSSVQKETPFITELDQIIKSVAPKSLTWKYSDEPNEQHNTIFRQTKEKALIWTLAE